MATKIVRLLFALALTPALLSAEQGALPFTLPVPDGWRAETILFPLEFAPELPYAGLEELRFAPGMFDPTSEELWSYAFVWWVRESDPVDVPSLETHLTEYFRGLAHAVGDSRGIEVGGADFEVKIEADGARGFSGRAETFDAFVTSDQILLNLEGDVVSCPTQDRQGVLFTLSPRAPDHAVWKTLGSIVEGFRCDAPRP